LQYYKNLEHFDLRYNKIEEAPGDLFTENIHLIWLSLSNNPLKKIHETAFRGLEALQFLHLTNTKISELPSKYGMGSLTNLFLKNTPKLFTIFNPENFKSLREVEVTYPYHCCAFRAKRKQEISSNNTRPCEAKPTIKSTTTVGSKIKRSENDTDDESLFIDSDMDDMLEYFSDIYDSFHAKPSNETPCSVEGIVVEGPPIDGHISIKCNPEPDAFNPCQDVMGTDVLRAFSWIISIFAILGNIFQLIILFYNKEELTVYKLLMFKLGFSNLMMGLYLLVLCCVDAFTLGQYYNYVQSWQYNGGCQAFGFIALFATQLSVCSLVLITVERFLLIIYALQVGNQMKLRHAKYGVALAWMYSFCVAVLPVTNQVNSYSKTAICLPLDLTSKIDVGYVIWLLLAYVIAFVAIMYCYIKMYRSINDLRPGIATRAIDIQVAKRMSLIIFSNFLSWLPISLVGFMALYSGIVFNVGVAKFLLVFFFPLNACTNPFLYAIFTKVFRSDTLRLLSSCGLIQHTDETDGDRARTTSYSKAKKQRAASGTKHFMHIQPPSTTYINNKTGEKMEVQTEFDSPETPIRTQIIDPKCKMEHLKDQSIKPRSESTRALLENHRFRTESSETSSSVEPLEDEDFNGMIGSVKLCEKSILHAV